MDYVKPQIHSTTSTYAACIYTNAVSERARILQGVTMAS